MDGPGQTPPPRESEQRDGVLQSLADGDSVSSAWHSDLGDYGYESESDAEMQWIQSLEQLEELLTLLIVPMVGKMMGRKAAFWGWAKFMEWKHSVSVVVSSPAVFTATGVLDAVLPV